MTPVAEVAGAAAGHVIVVTYNSAAHLPDLLADLAGWVAADEIVVTVVDNGSQDDTLDLLRACDWLRLVRAPENPGYAGGINRARAAGPTGVPVLVLNPDLRLAAADGRALLARVQRPEAGIAVPAIRQPDGTTYPSLRREPSLSRAIGDAVLGARFGRRWGRFSEMIHQTQEYPGITGVDWATGAALAISANCDAQVGDWDADRFFLYSEETDYCRRARDLGFDVRHVPEVVAVHAGGGSGQSPALEALLAVNRVRYYRKHHRRTAGWLFRAVVALHALARFNQPGQRRALAVLCGLRAAESLPGGRRGGL